MSDELLAIMQAEERAKTIVHQAEQRKVLSLKHAHEQRQKAFAGFKTPTPRKITVHELHPDTNHIKHVAAKNKEAAIAKILEAIYAT